MKCDSCTNEARWMIGNMQTGQQEAACDEHRGGNVIVQAAPPAAVADPNDGIPETTVCEICGLEPLAVIWDLPDHSTKMYLGTVCAGVQSRVAYLDSDVDLQEMINTNAEQTLSTMRGGRKSGRRGSKPVAVHEPGSNGETVEAKETAADAGAVDAGLAAIHDAMDPED